MTKVISLKAVNLITNCKPKRRVANRDRKRDCDYSALSPSGFFSGRLQKVLRLLILEIHACNNIETLFQHEVFVITPTLKAGSRFHVVLVMTTR
jgi:hypothetical protein